MPYEEKEIKCEKCGSTEKFGRSPFNVFPQKKYSFYNKSDYKEDLTKNGGKMV
ncbi:MAG: hypothetical protein ACTSXD_06080 [Candidatus Heimdallarchaeaceae archaeon]